MARAEPQKTKEGGWRQVYGERRFGALLVILAALLAGPPVLPGFGLSAAWFDALTALLLVAAILSLCFERHQRLFALLLGTPTVLLSVGGHALPGEASAAVLFAGHLCEVLFLFGASALIVRSLFSAPTLTFDSILGAVSGYLFLGLGWAVLYALVEGFRPGSFAISPKLVTGGEVARPLPHVLTYEAPLLSPAPDNVSGPPHHLTFNRRRVDNPDRVVEISDECGGGRRDTFTPSYRSAFRAGRSGPECAGREGANPAGRGRGRIGLRGPPHRQRRRASSTCSTPSRRFSGSANSVRTAEPSTMPDAHQTQVCAQPTAARQICAKTSSDRNVTPRNRKARTRSGVPSSTPATDSSARAIGSCTPLPRPVRNRSAVEGR
jgi:hypothetical protein